MLKDYNAEEDSYEYEVTSDKVMTLKGLCDTILGYERSYVQQSPKVIFRVITKFERSGDDSRTIEAIFKDGEGWRYTVGSLFLEQYQYYGAVPKKLLCPAGDREAIYTLSIAEEPAAELVSEEREEEKVNEIVVPVTVTNQSIHKTIVDLLKTEVIDTWFDKLKEDCDGHTLEFELGYRTALNTGLRALLNYRTKLWEAADES
jgi:hypothetical protein